MNPTPTPAPLSKSMAHRRSITARPNLFYQHRLSPSISHSHRHHYVSQNSEISPVSRNPQVWKYIHHRFFGAGNNFSNYWRSTSVFQDRGCGMACTRNYSSEADKIEVLNEVVGVLGDKVVEVAPVANEVSIAAEHFFPPVAAIEYLIDYVHCSTGLSWWASIAATTIIVRLLILPLVLYQMKSSARYSLVKPQWDAFVEELANKGPVDKGDQANLNALIDKYDVSPLDPLKEHLVSVFVFCSFLSAVIDMAEKVPSFKEGGTLWFTDLTTPDSFYVLPVLTALTSWLILERNAGEGKKGNMKVLRIFAVFTVPVVVGCPKAIFFYWITANLFSLEINNPQVKKLLGIPIVASINQKSKRRKSTGKKM